MFERSAGSCHTFGLQLHAMSIARFATLAQSRTGALVIGSDPFFTSRSEHLTAFPATKRIYMLTTI
jgi:hypothetical protein